VAQLLLGLNGQQTQSPVMATLIEAHEFEPCDWNCMFGNRPTTAYCIRIGKRVEVGEHSGLLWLGQNDQLSLRNEAGKAVLYEDHNETFWLTANGRKIKANRGTKFEAFTDASCRAEVHKAKLEEARKSNRPLSIPGDAVAISGSFVGDYRPNFVWHQCTQLAGTITCRKWYPDGASRGFDYYCPTAKSVDSYLDLNQIASVEGNLVLASGEALRFDHRGRTNNVLNSPSEACH
jgi:hypothetical protein